MSAHTSSILTGVMLLLALVAMVSMLEFWGTHERRPQRPELLLWIHRVSGWLFVALFVFMMLVMLARLARHTGELSARLVAHLMIALAIAPVLFLKILIVRRYGGLAQLVVPLGATLTVLAVCLAGPTAGVYLVKRLAGTPAASLETAEGMAPGSAAATMAMGSQLVATKCAKCHSLERVYALKLPLEAWQRTVEQMRSFDPTHISVEESRQIVYYLSHTLAPPKELNAQQRLALEGRLLLESRCARRCHNLEKVLALRRDRADWVRVVNEMAEQAAGTISSKDITILVEYLVQERGLVLGTRQALQAGESLLYKKCVKCHALDRIFRKRGLSLQQWQKLVEEMISFDRRWISAMEGRAIAQYLNDTLR